MAEWGLTAENIVAALPEVLARDSNVLALAQTIAEALAEHAQSTALAKIYPRIDELDEEVLDALAYDFKVDWWYSAYTLKQKREVLKSSFLVRKRMGTKYAVETAIGAVYPGTMVEEWFEYGGEPYFFRLYIDLTDTGGNVTLTDYDIDTLLTRLNITKPLRAHMENYGYMVRRAIAVSAVVDCWLYCAPECGTIRCGTWWTTSTLGWSEHRALSAGASPEAFAANPELTGTLPQISTAGYSLCGQMRSGGAAQAYTVSPELTGTLPDEA